jgi:hypothetical protein
VKPFKGEELSHFLGFLCLLMAGGRESKGYKIFGLAIR